MYAGPHKGAPQSVMRQRNEGKNVGKSLYCGVCQKEWSMQDNQV